MIRRFVVVGISIAIVAGAVGGIAFRSCARAQNPATTGTRTANEPHLLVSEITVHPITAAETVRMTGQVEAFRVAAVAAEVADRVESRPAERGDRVTVGQTIALLNDDLAIAAL